jgi:hypothetical protein
MKHTELTDELSEQLTLYALGALEGVLPEEWETHLATGCRVCQQELVEIRSTLAWLAYNVPLISPPAHLKARLFERVRASSATLDEPVPRSPAGFSSEGIRLRAAARKFTSSIVPPSSQFWGWRIGSAFAIAAVVVGLAIDIGFLLRTIEAQKAQVAALKAELAHQQPILALLESPQVHIVVMNGRQPSPQGHGKIMWDSARKKALLYITNLPPAPKDKDYQLWQIVNDKPMSAGVFNLSTKGDGFFHVEPVDVNDLKQINAFAVTLEPKGGVPQPTGPIYLLGKPSL